jgi:branched-chain amino acid transport system permease protein
VQNAVSSKIGPLKPGAAAAVFRSVFPVLIVLGLAALMYWVVGPKVGDFPINVLSKVGIFIMLAVSLNLVNGFTGQFSIGHAGFMAVGAYASGIISYYGSLWFFGNATAQEGLLTWGAGLFLLGCAVGGVMAAITGYLVGLPSLRLRGDYLAIVTLGFGEIVRVLLTQTNDVLYTPDEMKEKGFFYTLSAVGGSLGFGGVPWYNNLFWTTLLCGLTLLVCYRLKLSATGRAFLSVREDEIAAQAMGIDVTKVKVRAFVISSALAGVAGGVFAHQSGNSLIPGELNFQLSFDILIMVVLGGLGSISGAALAAVLVTVLSEWLKDPSSVIWLGLGTTAMLTVIELVREKLHLGGAGKAGYKPLIKGIAFGVIATLLLEGARLLAVKYGIKLSDYRMVLYALILILVMLLRPNGLFGVQEVWDFFRPQRKKGGTPT